MGALGAAGLLLRRLRAERAMVALICLVVAATSFLFAAAPRAFNQVADDALRYAVRVATPTSRDVTMSLIDQIPPAGPGSGIDGVRRYGDDLAKQLPPSVAALVGTREDRVTTARLSVPNPPSYETHMSLRYQDGVKDRTRLVAGRWPVDLGVPLSEQERGTGAPDGGGAEPAVVEIALSVAEATEIRFGLGDRIRVIIDGSDPLVRGLGYTLAPTEVQVVGLFEALDPGADDWVGDTDLLEVAQRGTDDDPIAYATAFVAAEAYPSLAASGLPFHYDWRFRVDPSRLDGGRVPALLVDLRRVGFITGSPAQQGTPVIITGLPRIIDRYAAERALSESVLSIAAVGPFGLAGGAVAMLGLLLVRQRRGALALARGRGASGALLLGAQLWEGIVLVGAASLLGLLAAVASVDARASALSPVLAIGSGGLAILLVAGATWPLARRPLGLLERDDTPVLRVAPRRLVAELTVVAVAIGAALLLRQRGLTFDAPGGLPRPDPLLAAVPVLSGIAAGIVVLRLYPLPIAALGWLAARGRGFVAVLGLRTIGRHPAAANLPILVLMLTAAFGGFSSVIASTLDRGQVAASYLRVGADFRVERVGLGVLDPGLDPATVPGVQAVAPGFISRSARFSSLPYQFGSIYLVGIDPRSYDAVTAGLPADPQWPAAFLDAHDPAGLGTDANPIPALLSSLLPTGSADLAPGDTFRMTVAGSRMTFQLVERRASFAGIPAGFPFAVVPYDWVEDAMPGQFLPPSAMWLRAADDASAPLAAAIAEHGGFARIISRPDAYAELHDSPLVRIIGTGYGAALVVAAIYMALTMVGALVLSAARRSRDTAYLRTLGVTAGQTLGLTILEHGLPALLAILPGVALGIGVAILSEPGLGLATFIGSDRVPLYVDWFAIGILVAALSGVVAVAVVAGTWLARRTRPADALRVGDD